MVKITKIIPREIIDSRGNPTVEVDVYTSEGFGRALVPSGASTGEHEALELRDKDKRFLGKGVLKAIENINKLIAPKVIGMEVTEQEAIDNLMLEIDGTENKSKLGANAMLGVSLAVCKAAANGLNLPIYEYMNKDATSLPVPMLNVINGGKHAGGNLKIQEFMLIPHGFKRYSEALRAICEVYQVLRNNLKKFGPSAINLGDEGGFGSPVDTAPEALDMLVEAIEDAGYKPGKQISIGLDSAASEFFEDSLYEVDGKKLTGSELVDYYVNLVNQYPIISIEDPFDENDFESFAKLHAKVPDISVVADDLTVTNPKRIQMAIDKKAANYLLLKVNQIGTLTESIQAANLARNNGWGINISHRSGETEDAFIADLAVALGAERIKTGAPARGERTAKYNQLLRIEEQLGDKAKYLGSK
ncbi:MAG: phosphopyruvate hydratase [Candidatus Heimdallarchaeota archaeon]|nr:phosphopyruvate hydratase [Candidatus Heimdallarchaeota archaeon]MCK4610089.1 phosphopyruvate hydratase [Candidatus Heimdallarchaeota archaeon]